MMQAARDAGFTNISIGSEAESLLAVFLAGNETSLEVSICLLQGRSQLIILGRRCHHLL